MSEREPCPVATIFARRVRAGSEAAYEEWLAGINHAAAQYRGNLGTTILRPSDARADYVAITHFDSDAHMREWLDSEERAAWLAKLAPIAIEHEEIQSLAGMERWFTLPHHGSAPPPRYKTAVLVMVGLYPTVLLLQALLGPLLASWPAALSQFVSLLCGVALMTWVVSPFLSRVFARWLGG